MRGAGGVDQRLRGNAADVEARSAEPIGFDEDRVEAELAGADRRDIYHRPLPPPMTRTLQRSSFIHSSMNSVTAARSAHADAG